MEEKKLKEETRRKFCACPRAPRSFNPSDVRESRKKGRKEKRKDESK